MPQHLVSLKSKPSDDAPILGGGDRFPTLFLSDDEVEALQLSDASVGDTVRLIFDAKVTSVSEHEDEDGVSRSVHLELTEGATEDMPEATETKRASLLFGDS